jgi:hypothetical protein
MGSVGYIILRFKDGRRGTMSPRLERPGSTMAGDDDCLRNDLRDVRATRDPDMEPLETAASVRMQRLPEPRTGRSIGT